MIAIERKVQYQKSANISTLNGKRCSLHREGYTELSRNFQGEIEAAGPREQRTR